MTIDNHIKILKSYHNGFTGWVSNIQDCKVLEDDDAKSNSKALN